jgi:JmjC domain, hydroxylase
MEYFRSMKFENPFGVDIWFPAVEELKERGIVYQYIVQKPGDAVYNGYDCPHWVWNPVSDIRYSDFFRMEVFTLLGTKSGLQNLS